MSSKNYYGIDLGTSNSSIAYVTDDPRMRRMPIIQVEVVDIPKDAEEDSESKRLPSIVSRSLDDPKENRTLIGWEFFNAFRQHRKTGFLLRHGKDFFRSVKSDMGTNKVYPYAFSPALNSPVKVSAKIIRKLIDITKDSNPIHDPLESHFVITVPASFGALARQDTLQAARDAGIDSSRVELIDEPVAALVDLLNSPDAGSILESDHFKYILVYDFGGGTCDLALVKAKFDDESHTGLHIENLAISHYRRLGGDDIDREVMEEVVWPKVSFDEKSLGANIRKKLADTLTVTVARDLKERMCREVNKLLRKRPDAWDEIGVAIDKVVVAMKRTFELPGLMIPHQFEMTPDEFENIMYQFSDAPSSDDPEEADPRSLIAPIQEILHKANLEPGQLDVVVLHGGSCRNPYVRKLIEESLNESGSLFGEVMVVQTPDMDTSVARGAALAAYWRQARGIQMVAPIMPEHLGILTLSDIPVSLLKAGTRLPYPDDEGVKEVEEEFFVPGDYQSELLVPFYTASRGCIAGTIRVPLPKGTRKGASVRIKLSVDSDKRLRWWFSINKGPYTEADSVNNPWTAQLHNPKTRRLLEHRMQMRMLLEQNQSIPPDMLYQEAYLLFKSGHINEAILAVEDYMNEHQATPLAWNLKGLIYGSTDDVEEEICAYRNASALDPNDAVLKGNYGCALSRANRNDEAIAAIRSALSVDPNLGYLYEWLGGIYRNKGDETAALREFRRAAVLAEQVANKNENHPESWSTLERICRNIGEYEKADEAKQKADKLVKDGYFSGDSNSIIAGKDSGLWLDE